MIHFRHAFKVAIVLVAPALVAIVYAEASKLWVPFGGTRDGLLRLELPILIGISLALFGLRLPSSRLHLMLVISCLLSYYGLFDIVFRMQDSMLRLSDMANLTTLAAVSDFWRIVVWSGVAGLIALPMLALGVSLRSAKRPIHWLGILAAIALLGSLFSVFANGLTPKQAETYFTRWNNWDDFGNVRRYGRLSSVLVKQGLRRDNYARLSQRPRPDSMPDFVPSLSKLPTINLIVLESFTDPRLYQNVSFSRSPLHPKLRAWMGSDVLDLIDVPVYGGGTAQTEFELFTGAPAMSHYGKIEFNSFNGYPIDGLLQGLRDAGYGNTALIATSARFYNSARAYSSLGFDERCFIDDCSSLRNQEPYRHIHDEDLFEQSVRKHCADTSAPCFRYILGMYGHVRLERHLDIRPDVIEAQVDGKIDQTFTDLSNQFYYRSHAIAKFLDMVNAADPTSITVVVSDHLPPILNGDIRYSLDKRTTIALMFVGKRRVSLDGLRSWEVPFKLLEELGTPNTGDWKAGAEDRYHYAIKQGIGS